jgi:hypothetical protein
VKKRELAPGRCLYPFFGLAQNRVTNGQRSGWHALRYTEGRGSHPRPSEYLRACHPKTAPSEPVRREAICAFSNPAVERILLHHFGTRGACQRFPAKQRRLEGLRWCVTTAMLELPPVRSSCSWGILQRWGPLLAVDRVGAAARRPAKLPRRLPAREAAFSVGPCSLRARAVWRA